jgi:hypothetical protein
MTTQQKLTFRELQIVFFTMMSEYPNDKDRMERGFIILENFIDKCINEALGTTITQNTKIYQDGKKKN